TKTGPTVNIIDQPVPEPGEGQVLIKVVAASTNPKDFKVPELAADDVKMFAGIPLEDVGEFSSQGDDLAGYVEKIGAGVVGFHVGDRVGAMHEMCRPHGAWAEYAIAWANTTWHIPDNISFEEAATVSLNGLTAAVSLFLNLRLPSPWSPATAQCPLIIYGAGTAVGSFAIKLAKASNIHPVIAVAGNSAAAVKLLLDDSKGDAVVDYRQEPHNLVNDIKTALLKSGTGCAKHAINVIGDQRSIDLLKEILDPSGHIDFILPVAADLTPLTKTETYVQNVHKGLVGPDARTLGYLVSRWFTLGLETGALQGHPFEVKKGGLGALESALRDLKAQKNKGLKYVVRIGETDGVSAAV
ncbi:hypothetical protein KEM52_001240, partial [Ascosphaera acerosa]